MPPADDSGRARRPERPDYKVYRARRGILSGLRKPDLSTLRKQSRDSRSGRPPRSPRGAPAKGDDAGPSPWRRVAKWVLIAAGVWLVISILAFVISSHIQKGKLNGSVNGVLHGNPFMAVDPQTVLVLGTDIRSGQFAGADEAASKFCLDAADAGRPPPSQCTPYRSDTIMLVRAGGGVFRKLSIPRDTLADIPGHGPDKINSAYALGGAKLTVKTVEQMLGVNVDEIAIIDFDGFRKFIDSIGGVNVDVPVKVCSSISGGAFKLNLSPGEHELNGYQAIALARTRESDCDGDGIPDGNINDFTRTKFQQLILDGIKSRLTSVTRLPYNFLHGPFIGWNAPKAIVSSMGAWTMPQLAFAAAIGGGGGETDFLKPSSTTAFGNLVVPPEECLRAVKKFLGSDPPHDPECSPPA